jgi:3-dehydroquinate synthase
VAMGMLAATRLAERLGMVSADVFQRLVGLQSRYGLPSRIDSRYSPDAMIEAFKTDKKQLAGKLHFILPTGIGSVVERHDLDMALLREVLGELQTG